MTLSELKKQLTSDTYVPRTEEELLAQAQNRYTAEYGEKKLATQQAYTAQDTALKHQAEDMQSAYAGEMEKSAANTRQNLSQAERAALSKGMQRSSYNAASLNGIRAQGESSLNALRQGLLQEQGRLAAQRTQLANDLADKMAQFDISFSADVQAYLDSLRDQEYDRAKEAKQYADKIAQALYEYELKAAKSSGRSGSSSSRGKKSSSGAESPSTFERLKQTIANSSLSRLGAILSGSGLKSDGIERKNDSDNVFSRFSDSRRE